MHFLQFSDFGAKWGFWAITLVLDMLEGQARVLSTRKIVSKTSLSQNFGPWDWRPGRVKVGQKNENTPTLRASPRRTPHPNQKMFFFIEPRRLSASVEGLNTSVAKAAGEL